MMKYTTLKSRFRKHAQISNNRGFTLIELMVALALGVILMLSITQIFAGMKSSYRFQENIARVQEQGRIAINLISQQARLAGFRRPAWDDPMQGFYPVTGGSADGGVGVNDTLQIMYMDDLDCFDLPNGAAIHAETNLPVNWYKQVTFSVDANDNLIWSCDYGPTIVGLAGEIINETIASGVDSFQVLYGVDTDLPLDFSLNSWAVASAITPQTSICIQSRYLCETDPGSLVANMSNGVPVSLQLGLLLRSPERVSSVDNVAFTVLDEDVAAAGELVQTILFVTTINLRNLTL